MQGAEALIQETTRNYNSLTTTIEISEAEHRAFLFCWNVHSNGGKVGNVKYRMSGGDKAV